MQYVVWVFSVLKGCAIVFFLLFIQATFFFPGSVKASMEEYEKAKTKLNIGGAESINPFNGALSIAHTTLVVPGNGGLDIEVKHTYQPSRIPPERINKSPSQSKWRLPPAW